MRKLNLLILMAIFSGSVLQTSTALASLAAPLPQLETIHLGGNFYISDSETKSLPLDGPRYVKNLVIQAQGGTSDSQVEVMVNGQVKGTLVAPGHDPSYVVTVEETTRSIEFRHRAGGAMRIIEIKGTVSPCLDSPINHGGEFSGSKDQVLQLALTALKDIEALDAFATPDEDTTYLFPIKRNAGLVYVMASAHGELSRRTVQQLVALSDQIDFARRYLDLLMQKGDAFDTVVDLLTVREKINALLE